jgi:hypothetical protein
MSDGNAAQPRGQQQGQAEQLQIHVAPDLEYCYRDLANVYFGAESVIIELGNRHNSPPKHATVANRIVLTPSVAYQLQQALMNGLRQWQNQRRQQQQQQQAGAGENQTGDQART